MFPFKKKSSRGAGLTALGLYPEGIALARVSRGVDVPPVLEVCEYAPVEREGEWEAALGDLTRRHGLDAGSCTVLVEEGVYSLLLVEAPEVPPEELRAAVRWRIRDLIDFHIDDAVIDVFDVPSQRGTGRPRMMYVVAARVPRVREKTDAVQEAGLDLAVVDIPELAQRNLAAELPEDVAGVALLCLSEHSGLITLTRQGTLYLARRLDTGLAVLGPGPWSLDIAGVRDWLDGLVVEVQRSLDYYESNFAQPPIGALVVMPVDPPFPEMERYLAEQLGLSVRSLDLNAVVDCPDAIEPARQALCAAVVGAALRRETRTL